MLVCPFPWNVITKYHKLGGLTLWVSPSPGGQQLQSGRQQCLPPEALRAKLPCPSPGSWWGWAPSALLGL